MIIVIGLTPDLQAKTNPNSALKKNGGAATGNAPRSMTATLAQR